MLIVFIHGLALLFVMVIYQKHFTDLARSMATRHYSSKQMAMITALFQRRAAHKWYFTRFIFIWSMVTAIAADVLWMSNNVWLIWVLCIICSHDCRDGHRKRIRLCVCVCVFVAGHQKNIENYFCLNSRF